MRRWWSRITSKWMIIKPFQILEYVPTEPRKRIGLNNNKNSSKSRGKVRKIFGTINELNVCAFYRSKANRSQLFQSIILLKASHLTNSFRQQVNFHHKRFYLSLNPQSNISKSSIHQPSCFFELASQGLIHTLFNVFSKSTELPSANNSITIALSRLIISVHFVTFVLP